MNNEKTEYLARRAKDGDTDAFAELIQLHMKDMYRTALAILMNDSDAADAIQDAILACFEKIGSLKHEEYFKTWLTRILINKCKDIKKRSVNTVSLETLAETAQDDGCNLELKEAMSCLDEKYRIVFMLYYGEGYNIGEISDILKIPQSTVQTRLWRGRQMLAKIYYGTDGKE